MRRVLVLSVILLASFFLAEYYKFLCSNLDTFRSALWHRVILRKWVQRDHTLWHATNPRVELIGRWVMNREDYTQEAGFSGSRARFCIQNSSSMWIALQNVPTPRVQPQNLSPYQGRQHLSFKWEENGFFGHEPVSLLVSLNETAFIFDANTYGNPKVLQDLTQSETYNVVIELLPSSSENTNTVRLEGVWLSKGATIHRSAIDLRAVNSGKSELDDNPSKCSHGSCTKLREVVEIVAPAGIVSCRPTNDDVEQSLCNNHYGKVLERSRHFDITTTTCPYPSFLCMTSRCSRNYEQNKHQYTLPDLYFRSGMVDTPLFHRTWSWSSHPRPPSLLVLDVGLTDFQDFISGSAQPQDQRSLDSFVTDFVNAYIEFVLTIRRASWHQTPHHAEPAYMYTSAPSTLPILIMTPAVPPSYEPALTRLLFNSLQRVVHTLRSTEGDQHTVLIDTSGWLDESDFGPHLEKSNENGFSDEGLDHPAVGSIPMPNVHGHAKLAYFLSGHLCPYLHSDSEVEACAFDRHDTYRGNLYDPTSDHLARLLEEKKIDEIKSMIGLGMVSR